MLADPQVRNANGCKKDVLLVPLVIVKVLFLALFRGYRGVR